MATERNLIQRMAKELDTWLMAHHYGGVPPEIQHAATLVAEARAFLAQPEPEAPTDEELLFAFYEASLAEGGDTDEVTLRGLRAVLARWGK